MEWFLLKFYLNHGIYALEYILSNSQNDLSFFSIIRIIIKSKGQYKYIFKNPINVYRIDIETKK